MIPNVVKGDRMAGLIVYLASPGRSNEHTEPHLVAGDPAMMAWHDDNELDRDAALRIAKHLDRPKRAFDVEVSGGHVWHCSLSIAADEGRLDDDTWRQIAERFVEKMGFDTQQGTKAPTRWVAIHHGQSVKGNDHIHLAVNLVREDGTKANTHRDWVNAQKASREIEREFGLRVLDGSTRGRSGIGFHPAELEAEARRRARGRFEQARRKGSEKRTWASLTKDERAGLIDAVKRTEQPRFALARTVRGCATAAADEAEFVRRLRRAGVLVRPRYAEGAVDVITGYSVAHRPQFGERPMWYGGGSLAHDLKLPRLREEWPDTAEGATAAAAEWNAAKRGRRPVAPGREAHEFDPEVWTQISTDLDRLRAQLRAVPLDDREAWARVARQTSGAFAAWSTRVEPTPGPLAATADALARSAHLRERPLRPIPAGMVSASGAAMLLAAGAKGGRGAVAQAVMLRQLAGLSKAVFDAHRADQDARRAAAIERAMRRDLAQVSARLPDPGPVGLPDTKATAALRVAQQAQGARAKPMGSPVPARLEPHRPDVAATHARRPAGRDERPGMDR